MEPRSDFPAGAFWVKLDPQGTDLSTEGDSGGPVYSTNGAWGMISGCYPTFTGCNDAIFVAANYIESSMSAVIKTS
jgi:hypothetical protein